MDVALDRNVPSISTSLSLNPPSSRAPLKSSIVSTKSLDMTINTANTKERTKNSGITGEYAESEEEIENHAFDNSEAATSSSVALGTSASTSTKTTKATKTTVVDSSPSKKTKSSEPQAQPQPVEEAEEANAVERNPPCHRCRAAGVICKGLPSRFSCSLCYKRHWACGMQAPPIRQKKPATTTSPATTRTVTKSLSAPVPKPPKPPAVTTTTSKTDKITSISTRGRSPSRTLAPPRLIKRTRSPSVTGDDSNISGSSKSDGAPQKRTRTGLRSFVATNGNANPSAGPSKVTRPHITKSTADSRTAATTTTTASTPTINETAINARIAEFSALVQNQQLVLESHSQLLNAVLANMRILLGDKFVDPFTTLTSASHRSEVALSASSAHGRNATSNEKGKNKVVETGTGSGSGTGNAVLPPNGKHSPAIATINSNSTGAGASGSGSGSGSNSDSLNLDEDEDEDEEEQGMEIDELDLDDLAPLQNLAPEGEQENEKVKVNEEAVDKEKEKEGEVKDKDKEVEIEMNGKGEGESAESARNVPRRDQELPDNSAPLVADADAPPVNNDVDIVASIDAGAVNGVDSGLDIADADTTALPTDPDVILSNINGIDDLTEPILPEEEEDPTEGVLHRASVLLEEAARARAREYDDLELDLGVDADLVLDYPADDHGLGEDEGLSLGLTSPLDDGEEGLNGKADGFPIEQTYASQRLGMGTSTGTELDLDIDIDMDEFADSFDPGPARYGDLRHQDPEGEDLKTAREERERRELQMAQRRATLSVSALMSKPSRYSLSPELEGDADVDPRGRSNGVGILASGIGRDGEDGYMSDGI